MRAQSNRDGLEVDIPQDFTVWEGFTTRLFKELNLAVPYYTSVMNELQRMDCVRQMRRGGSTTPSQWLLLRQPTRELFDGPDSPARSRKDLLEQQLRDLAKRVAVLEEERGIAQ